MPGKPNPETRKKRTIALELLKKWKECNRRGDAKKIAEKLVKSKPTIDNALIYGHVTDQVVLDGINEYFASRLMKEKEMAQELHKLNGATNTAA